MRALSAVLVATLLSTGAISIPLAANPDNAAKKPPFDTTAYRPIVVLQAPPLATDRPSVTIRGVVFSRAPLEQVTVGERTATLREAAPADLSNLRRLPDGATDAPHRTYFEAVDIGLGHFGVNDIDVRALASDGRASDLHRVAVVRSVVRAPAPAK